jgi:serine O-acetyltransferase
MFDLIRKDLSAQVKDQKIIVKIKHMVLHHTVHLLLLIRLGYWCQNNILFIGPVLRLIIEYLVRVFFASDISCKAKISGGLNIMHGHDIVIGSLVIVGENVKIFNGVTLGNKDTESDLSQQPMIGNNVVIGTGAKILGGIKIGNNSIIGANSVVTKDMPPYSIIAGVPARVIKRRSK